MRIPEFIEVLGLKVTAVPAPNSMSEDGETLIVSVSRGGDVPFQTNVVVGEGRTFSAVSFLARMQEHCRTVERMDRDTVAREMFAGDHGEAALAGITDMRGRFRDYLGERDYRRFLDEVNGEVRPETVH